MGMDYLKNLIKKQNKLTRSQIRRARPHRNSALEYIEEKDGRVTLKVPLSKKGKIARFVSRSVDLPEHKQVELEPIGAMVWKLCDGKHTVEGIISKLQEEYKISKVEAEASLLTFLDTLEKRRFVSIEVPEK
jgi:hypothetical protein